MTTSTSPCGKNPALEEAKNKATELKEKVNGGLDALSDLPNIVAQLRAALEEINNKPAVAVAAILVRISLLFSVDSFKLSIIMTNKNKTMIAPA
jgi:hypothetical protein